MGTPLGDFVRAKRDSIRPESFGIPERGRRRSPGLRRTDLAARAGISVEYLTRIEQGRDRNPSPAVVNALADGLSLDAGERDHLRYLAKISSGSCVTGRLPEPAGREVRPTVLATLRLLEPAAAYVTNRLGDVLAHTDGFARLARGSGLLDGPAPNLTRYAFTDARARTFFADWEQVADELAFDLWFAPTVESSQWLRAQLEPLAGEEFTRRLERRLPPPRLPLRTNVPALPGAPELRWERERLELSGGEGQELVVLLPADEATERAAQRLHRGPGAGLRAIG